MAVKEGDRVPDFTLKDRSGKDFTLYEHPRKGPVVLYFYPRDDTPGCTAQACAFRDSYEDFREAGAEVVGISSDSGESHSFFIIWEIQTCQSHVYLNAEICFEQMKMGGWGLLVRIRMYSHSCSIFHKQAFPSFHTAERRERRCEKAVRCSEDTGAFTGPGDLCDRPERSDKVYLQLADKDQRPCCDIPRDHQGTWKMNCSLMRKIYVYLQV